MKPSEEKAWLKHYAAEVVKAPVPKTTIYGYFRECNRPYLDYEAINYYGYRLTYREMIDRIEYFASCYASWGIKKDDKVLFLSVSLPETLCSLYALNKIGAIPVFIEPRMAKDRIEHFVNITQAKTLVILDQVFPKVKGIIEKYNLKTVFIQSPFDSLPPAKKVIKNITTRKPKIQYNDVVRHFGDLLVSEPSVKAVEAPYVEGSVAVITQTGGTTGVPKGVMLTNDGLNSVAFSVKNSYTGLKPGDRFLNIMPVFTSYGISNGIQTAFCITLSHTLVPGFKPAKFAGLMKKHNPACVIGVPSFFESLTTSKNLRHCKFEHLVFPVSGGDYMSLSLEKKMDKFFENHSAPTKILQGYGLSETTAATSFSFNRAVKNEAVGIPMLASTMGIFNPDTLEELDYGETGEICITGPSIMKGYLNDEEETKNVMKLHPDGRVWIHSGDLGYLDKDGFLFFNGRIKHVIPRFDGHKNYPAQIEKVVMQCKSVKNCAVVGCKDREHSHGMYPLIIAELADKSLDSNLVRSEILDLCKNNVEERGQPCDVIIIDQIPLTLIGKNDVTELSKRYSNYDYTQKTKNNRFTK